MASVAPREVEICGEVSKNFFGMDSDGNNILEMESNVIETEKPTFYVRVDGGYSVGKLHLLDIYVNENDDYFESQRECWYCKRISLDQDVIVNLKIEYPAALRRYQDIDLLPCIGEEQVLNAYHPIHAFIVVYDITQRHSFAVAKRLVDDFTKEARPGAFVALVGNKADLESIRKVFFEEAQNYADENNIVEIFMEVSALTGENVEDLFSDVAKRLTAPLSVISETLALEVKTLDLSGRHLDGDQWIYCIEEFLRRRKNVKKPANILSLNLSHNCLEKLPNTFLPLINLTCLYVNNNRLSSLPESMKHLKRLQELDLRNNQLKVLDVVRKLPNLRKLLVEGNPLIHVEIRSLIKHVDTTTRSISVDIAAVAPPDILAQGHSARLVYEEALRDGFVNVYRGRIILVGQDRAGKTSLKKTLLGLPFDYRERSTDGIEIEPSKFEIEVEQINNWTPSCANKSSLSECLEYTTGITELLARERYHMIVRDEKEDSEMKSVGAQPKEERRVESGEELHTKNVVANKVSVYEYSATKFPDRSKPLSEVHEGDNLSTKSKMAINATVLSNTVEKQADELLKNMIVEGVDVDSTYIEKGSSITADVWDFAGQHLYYAAHPVFFSSRAVYIVVHNLSKSLYARAQPCVRQGTHEVPLENPNNETNLENLLSWLVTVHNVRSTGEEMVETPNELPYLRPPVFIVGTHADKPYEDRKDVSSKILREISSKEYGKHVIRPFFYIDNTQGDQSFARKFWNFFKFQRNRQTGQEGDNDGTDADEIHALRARILEVLRQEPYMGEKIPVRWFNFEKVIEALVAENVYHSNTVHLQTYAKDVCFIEDDEQFHTMLNFYHDLGLIVKHRSTVILKAQWLISLFKKLITIPAFKKTDPVHSKYWLELETSGVLKMELVDHVFSPLIQQGVIKEDILDMMEQFGLIAKYSPSPADVYYFVPCQLKSSPEELCKMEPSSTDPCPLYLHFQEGFVPHGFFTRLVSKSVAWCGANGSSQPPKLYQNGAWFILEERVIYDMIMICKKKFIKILLRQRIKKNVVAVSSSTLVEIARSVLLFMESTLEKMSQEFPYLSRMQHEFCVECPYCQQSGRKCVNHNQVSCGEEDCLHLLELRQGQDLICMESMSNEVLIVPGQEKWLLNQGLAPSEIRTSQVGSMRGHPAKRHKTLKVTLLANEWNSSRGGLSTINRHLAILMAERNEVEVTLLVPQYACSEEEKRIAESHKIVIKEAERRPGYDPLDWLSFPPRELIIDVVLGHGAKLGKQAQIIRESHSCQWVQVVHTAPEELGMFKNYPRAIAKGQEKTTAEVDLCKLANLVVAVGPKLTEAYSAYLRSCEKQQDIMSFTPGTLKEFSTLNHASVDSVKFRVLIFGRGDPEDFGLKGCDIAAKAVAELKDNSYHLIFVGAPDGKQEAVAQEFLRNGISKRQLTVRTFLQSKEKLKDCFREVDLCIMPSRTEGFGLTALEALSAGLPILVSGNSGFGDALRTVPFGTSFVVDSEDPKVWAEAIDGVRKMKRLPRLQGTERLRTSYEMQFSWEKQCDLLVDLMWNKVHGVGVLERTLQNLQRMQLCASTVNDNTTLSEKLATIASDKGFRISDNQGSVNCMFHALSEQLETVKRIKIQHGQLRQSLVQYLRENPKLPDGTDLRHFVHEHETWADYLTYMEQDGAWGDHLILYAAANCFKTCIHVVSSIHNDVDIRPHGPVGKSKPLVLGHIHEVHYVSLQLLQG